LVVSIAYAGCADKKTNKVTVIPLHPRWDEGVDWKSNAVLKLEIVDLERKLREAKIMPKQEALLVRIAVLEAEIESQREVELTNKALLVRIDDLETALESQREFERIDKALLVRISKLEAALDSQRAVIENLKNVQRLYDAALDYQRVALESLLNLCRLYEAKIESQRAAIEKSQECTFLQVKQTETS